MTMAQAYIALNEIREMRRPPLVAVGTYVCPACRAVHVGRSAQLGLGCAEAEPSHSRPVTTALAAPPESLRQ